MDARLGSLLILLVLIGCFAGCITGTESPPKTQPPGDTATVLPTRVPQGAAMAPDPELSGNWSLREMLLQNGQEQVQDFPEPVTAWFTDGGNLSGYGGCTMYQSSYVLTGEVNDLGNGITIGPLSSTKKSCGENESRYLQVLQDSVGYEIDSDMVLTMRDNGGNSLIFSREATK
jgi:heat shock protein HslJ